MYTGSTSEQSLVLFNWNLEQNATLQYWWRCIYYLQFVHQITCWKHRIYFLRHELLTILHWQRRVSGSGDHRTRLFSSRFYNETIFIGISIRIFNGNVFLFRINFMIGFYFRSISCWINSFIKFAQGIIRVTYIALKQYPLSSATSWRDIISNL